MCNVTFLDVLGLRISWKQGRQLAETKLVCLLRSGLFELTPHCQGWRCERLRRPSRVLDPRPKAAAATSRGPLATTAGVAGMMTAMDVMIVAVAMMDVAEVVMTVGVAEEVMTTAEDEMMAVSDVVMMTAMDVMIPQAEAVMTAGDAIMAATDAMMAAVDMVTAAMDVMMPVDAMTDVRAAQEMMMDVVVMMARCQVVAEMMTVEEEAGTMMAEAAVPEDPEDVMMMVHARETGIGSMSTFEAGPLIKSLLLSSQHSAQRQRCHFSEVQERIRQPVHLAYKMSCVSPPAGV